MTFLAAMSTTAEPTTQPRLHTIGAVCERLRAEFPDISISKIRYLEDQGLLRPRRTRGGYRLFSEADVERLETILRLQRDEFLPLRVIRDELETRGPQHDEAAAGRRSPTRAARSTSASSASAPGSPPTSHVGSRSTTSSRRGSRPESGSTARARSRSPLRAASSRGTASTRAICARSARPPGASRRCSSSSSPPGSGRATSSGAARRSTTSRRSRASPPSSRSTFSSATSGRPPSDDDRRAEGARARRPRLPDGGDRLQGPDAADRERRGVPLDRSSTSRNGRGRGTRT